MSLGAWIYNDILRKISKVNNLFIDQFHLQENNKHIMHGSMILYLGVLVAKLTYNLVISLLYFLQQQSLNTFFAPFYLFRK